MKLTLLALTYFQKTAELQHLTHAAEALHISQPSLSHTIKMLEQELGVPLFRRSGRNIVLTASAPRASRSARTPHGRKSWKTPKKHRT